MYNCTGLKTFLIINLDHTAPFKIDAAEGGTKFLGGKEYLVLKKRQKNRLIRLNVAE